MSQEKLLPCPFCGSHAELIHDDAWYYVHCQGDKCEVQTDGWKVKPLAISAWNRRPAAPAVPCALSEEEKWAMAPVCRKETECTFYNECVCEKAARRILEALVRRLIPAPEGAAKEDAK